MKNELQYFTKSGVKMKEMTMPGSTFVTDALDVSDFSGGFIIQILRTTLVGTVVFIVESSNDNVVWNRYIPIVDSVGRGVPSKTQDYFTLTTATNIPISTTTLEAMVQDQICLPNYLRLSFTSSGLAPTGNITASILKSKAKN